MTAVTVQFLANGQPVVPDLGSATYTIYGQDGGMLVSNVPVTVGPAATAVTVAIDPQYETRTLRFEKRTVVFNWSNGGASYSKRVQYRLTPFLNYNVGPDNIRSFLGLDPHELRDDEVDIISAYIYLEDRLGETALTNAFNSGGMTEENANRALLYATCLNVLPSLRLRLAKERSDGPLTWKRFDVEDFNELEARIRGLLEETIEEVVPTLGYAYTLITVSNPIDIITGG